jgi:hypothetical protein
MVTRHSPVVVGVLLAVVICCSPALGAKCYYPKTKATVAPVDTAETPAVAPAGTPTVSQTELSGTSGHATFGDVTSQKGACVVGNPNTFISTADVDDQWDRRMSQYVPTFNNLIFDQLVNNNATLNYCVRWDTDEKLTKSVASQLQDVIASQYKLWNQWLIGYDCWPFEKININVVAFAVKDKSIMDWTDDSLGTIYEGILDDEGSPKCPDECYKHLNQEANADTSACKSKPFDMSLWPSSVVGQDAIGAGGDWGQRVDVRDMLNTLGDEQMMVLAHEIGHGFGLPDFYEPTDKPSTFPAAVMDQSLTLTDADGWMIRRVLENIKSRYDF